jgi:hypothetical protein
VVSPQNAAWPDFIVEQLPTVLSLKNRPRDQMGWSPRMRERFGYCTPDEVYEAAVSFFVRADTIWLDVGCGRDLFPSNSPAAAMLARRCRLLVGLDPSSNIQGNALRHERFSAPSKRIRRTDATTS